MVVVGEANADGKWSEKKMEEEENSLRKVKCLRGRLLAERVASRNAKEESEIMGIKLIELEKQLKEETKSRNRAEKKLNFLIKKLESMNIAYVSDELSEYSSLVKSEIASVASTASSRTKQSEDKVVNSQDTECQESVGSNKCRSEKRNCEEYSMNLEKDASQMSTSIKDNVNPSANKHFGNSSDFEFSKSDANSLKSCAEEDEKNGGNELDIEEDYVDNSLSLIPMDVPKTRQVFDPVVVDATVREALDSLRHAKEKLQNQMERRQMMIRAS